MDHWQASMMCRTVSTVQFNRLQTCCRATKNVMQWYHATFHLPSAYTASLNKMQLRALLQPASRPSLLRLTHLCLCVRERTSASAFVRRAWCADKLLMSASQATLQMEDTHGVEKARAKHLGVNSPEKSPPRKVKWTHYCIQWGRHGLYRAEEINS